MYYFLRTTSQSSRHELLAEGRQLLFLLEVNNYLGLFFARIAIGLMLLRIFSIKTLCRQIIWVVLALVFATVVMMLVALFTQCRPLHTMWDVEENGTCRSRDVTQGIAHLDGGELLVG